MQPQVPSGQTSPAQLGLGGRWTTAFFALLGGALFLWIGRGSLDAGLVSEDSGVLRFVHEHGAFADWNTGQYGMRIVRFWRPLVTASIGLQEAWTGTDPSALRALNWACHLISIALGVVLVARLRASLPGVALAAIWLASFPFQGGTATWIVGRVDSLCLPFLLGAALAGVCGRAGWGALFCLLAAATKEIGFAAPLWFLFASLGASRPRAIRTSLLPLAAGAAAFGFRRWALGAWVGGYPKLGPEPPLTRWLTGMGELLALGGFTAPVLLALLLLTALFARERIRPALALVLCAGVTLAVVLPLVARGGIALEHRRWWLIPDAALGLSLALALPPARRFDSWVARSTVLFAGAALVLVSWLVRAPQAESDVAEWVLAGKLCDQHVERVRASLEGEPPSRIPVLDSTVTRTTPSGAAYVFHWGFAERFLEPFDPTPRPVWPWRRLFEQAGPIREVVTQPEKDLHWPFGERHQAVSPMPIRLLVEDREVTSFELSKDLVGRRDPGAPRIVVPGDYSGQRIEFVLHTAFGHEVGVWTGPLVSQPALWNGSKVPAVSLPLLSILESVEGVSLAVSIVQVADLGEQRAYLEIRATEDRLDPPELPISASPWIELTWDEEFRRALLP